MFYLPPIRWILLESYEVVLLTFEEENDMKKKTKVKAGMNKTELVKAIAA